MEMILCKVMGMGEFVEPEGKWGIWTLHGPLIRLDDRQGVDLAGATSAQALCLHSGDYVVKVAALSSSFRIKDGTILVDSPFFAFESNGGSNESADGRHYLTSKIYEAYKFPIWLRLYQEKHFIREVFDHRICPLAKVSLKRSAFA